MTNERTAGAEGGGVMDTEPDWILPRSDSYHLYFGVPDGNIANLPKDAVFDTIDTETWEKVRWRAVDRIEKYGKNKGEWGRVYVIVQERLLDADECGVWQQYIEEWEQQRINGDYQEVGG